MSEDRGQAPVLRVVRGNPTAEEVAALVAVVAAAGSGGAPPGPQPMPLWARSAREAAPLIDAGAGAWHASFLPR